MLLLKRFEKINLEYKLHEQFYNILTFTLEK